MRVRIDDVELPLGENILGEGKDAIYEEARRAAKAEKRVIIDIIVDGEPVGSEEAFFSLSGGLDIKFVTQPIRDLLLESMKEGGKYIVTLKRGLEAIATLFEESRARDAQAKFGQAIEGIRWLTWVFDKSCLLLGIAVENLKSGDFKRDFDDLNNALGALASSMESGRTMGQAFLIRERLAPAIDRFSGYWNEIASMVETPLQ
jgi:hypothetical protein